MTTLTDEVLLEDPRFYIEQDPHPIYARLRREAPVFRYENDGIAFWALSKWADLRAVSVDSDTFSSAKGIMVTDPREMRSRA